MLQFRLPSGSFGVAVEDVLNKECVYLPDYGVFVTRDPAPITLAAYKQKIAGRKTILQQVREMPDQTLAQSMARTHHEAQREGPVMLSLACDNAKFVVERDGTLRFQATTNLTDDWFATAAAFIRSLATASPARSRAALMGTGCRSRSSRHRTRACSTSSGRSWRLPTRRAATQPGLTADPSASPSSPLPTRSPSRRRAGLP